MNRLCAATVILVISSASPYVMAENYLPGEPLPRSKPLLERLSDAFFPGFHQQSDERYGNTFVEPRSSDYAFADEISRRDDSLLRTPGIVSSKQEAPVGNVFNFRF